MKMRNLLFFILFPFLIFSNTLNVPSQYPTIQTAIDQSVNGDTILVQPGTYIENINYNGKSIIIGSLYLTTNDTSYISQTILDGNNNGSVVAFENGEDNFAVLSGFSIINGYSFKGGGISCINSNPVLNNLYIYNNIAYNWNWPSGEEGKGGGVYCENADPVLREIIIKKNASWGELCSVGYCGLGGGIYLTDSSNAFIYNSIIMSNRSGDGAGIFCNNQSNPTFKNVLIYNNKALEPDETGAALYCLNNSKPLLINVTIVSNYADTRAGGIYCSNLAYPILINSILWHNYPYEIHFSYYYNPDTIVIAFSNISDSLGRINLENNGELFWLNGNINNIPFFVDTVNGNYSLLSNSSCIDAGIQDTFLVYNNNNDTVYIPTINYLGSAPDLGAFEFDPATNLSNDTDIIPFTFKLFQNYPNPFNSQTRIKYYLPKAGNVKIEIFDLLGQKLKTLINQNQKIGEHHLIWDGRDENNLTVASGVYIYSLTTDKYLTSKKLLFLK